MTKPDVVIVGAGAAGILAAWRAAQLGANVLILEKTVRLGTKILVSGGGKCNITHGGPLELVLKAFRPNEARFLRPSFYRFTNDEMVEVLVDRGLEVYTRPDGRIFPVHQTAKDVVAILRQMLDEVGVRIQFNAGVTRIITNGSELKGVEIGNETIGCPQIVVSVGGSSFPASGTTGDGWPWMRELGHRIAPLRAALAPIYLKLESESPSGVSLRDCILKARQGGKEFDRWRGDLLFTHHGLSGPCALGVSRTIAERQAEGEVRLDVDLYPDQTFETLSQRFLDETHQHPHRSVANGLERDFPARVVELILNAAQAKGDMRNKDLDKKTRNRLIESLKMLPLGAVRAVPLEKGEVVAGGVQLDEVDSKTMESTRVPGLFLCGEILDIAGPVGGYNLQAAWSTGYVAGESCANRALNL